MRYFRYIHLVLIALAMVLCFGNPVMAGKMKIAMVTDVGGVNDQSFNQSAWEGLQRAQKEIIQAEKLASIGRLSSGIAHEIGNPIGIIMGYLELLKQKNTSVHEKREYITRTEDEINRINTIIRQLLDLSRPSNDGAKAVSVHEIINDITEVVRSQPLMSNIRINHVLEARDDTVIADANQLRQVFLNLIINAADAIASGQKETKGELIIKSNIIKNREVN